jgi:hypothetical protein
MKKILYILFLVFAFVKVQAQIINPVKWEASIEKKSNSEFVLSFKGAIESGWHVYSQFTPEDGPLPAEFLYHDNKNNYELIGKATESETKREFNEIFGVDEIFFSDKVVFTQLIKQTNLEKETIQVELSYQVCK